MSRDTRYPVIAASLFLRPQYDPARRAGSDLEIGFLRLAKAAGLRNRRGAVLSRDKPRRQRLQYFRRGREVALQRIDTVEPAFVVIGISEVETHLALASRGDLDQPAAEGQAVDCVAEHDAADEIEDDIRPLAAGRRTDLTGTKSRVA